MAPAGTIGALSIWAEWVFGAVSDCAEWVLGGAAVIAPSGVALFIGWQARNDRRAAMEYDRKARLRDETRSVLGRRRTTLAEIDDALEVWFHAVLDERLTGRHAEPSRETGERWPGTEQKHHDAQRAVHAAREAVMEARARIDRDRGALAILCTEDAPIVLAFNRVAGRCLRAQRNMEALGYAYRQQPDKGREFLAAFRAEVELFEDAARHHLGVHNHPPRSRCRLAFRRAQHIRQALAVRVRRGVKPPVPVPEAQTDRLN